MKPPSRRISANGFRTSSQPGTGTSCLPASSTPRWNSLIARSDTRWQKPMAESEHGVNAGGEDDATVADAPAEEGEEQGAPHRVVENLLDRLLYKGVLPRYAFPTDVVSFYVFDRDQSTRFRPAY